MSKTDKKTIIIKTLKPNSNSISGWNFGKRQGEYCSSTRTIKEKPTFSSSTNTQL